MTRYACSPDRKPLPRSFRIWRTRSRVLRLRFVSIAMIESATANSAASVVALALVFADPERVRGHGRETTGEVVEEPSERLPRRTRRRESP